MQKVLKVFIVLVIPTSENRSLKNVGQNWNVRGILTKIHVYFIIFNAQSAKTFLKIAVFIKLDEIAAK